MKVNVEPVSLADTDALERGLVRLSLADAAIKVTATAKGERILACLTEIYLEQSVWTWRRYIVERKCNCASPVPLWSLDRFQSWLGCWLERWFCSRLKGGLGHRFQVSLDVGSGVSSGVGAGVGSSVGTGVAWAVGSAVGSSIRSGVSRGVGLGIGWGIGSGVGWDVGCRVDCMPQENNEAWNNCQRSCCDDTRAEKQ